MTDEEKYKLHDLCYRCKLGYQPTTEESQWLQDTWNKDPKEYSVISNKAAEEAMATVNPWGRPK